MSDKTTIPINKGVRDELRARKVGGETYSDVINRLLTETETES